MRLLLSALCIALAVPVCAAAAAPQILALVATPVPVPLRCDDTGCRAELTSFCLQEDRVSPRPGTRYHLAGGSTARLHLRFADGRRQRRALDDTAVFRARRSFSAVDIHLPALPAGVVAITLDVGDKATLVPAGEDDAAALAQARGPFRAIGSEIVETPASLAALGAMGALINALATPGGPTIAARIWAGAVAEPFAAADRQGLARARAAFDDCTSTMARANGEAARVCLRLRHDAMVDALTHDYWAAVRTGS